MNNFILIPSVTVTLWVPSNLMHYGGSNMAVAERQFGNVSLDLEAVCRCIRDDTIGVCGGDYQIVEADHKSGEILARGTLDKLTPEYFDSLVAAGWTVSQEALAHYRLPREAAPSPAPSAPPAEPPKQTVFPI